MILGLWAGISCILASWTVIALAFVGLGLGIRRLFGLKAIETEGLLAAFWMGFALVILLLQLWHFSFPVDARALAAAFVAGGAGLLWNRGELRRWRAGVRWREALPLVLTLVLAASWTANRAMGPPEEYDSGLYHIPVMQWSKLYPLVPGLANLNDRFGFNNSHLLYAAMLDVGPWAGRSSHLANGILLLALLVQVIVSGFRFVRGDGAQRGRHLFTLLLLAPVIGMISSDGVSSLATDVAAAVVLLVAGSHLFEFVTRRDREAQEYAYDLVVLTTLLVLALCVKLSTIAFVGVAWGLAVVVWLRRSERALHRRTLSWVAAIAFSLGLSWMARGVILSGYPAYPITVGAFAVEWRAPTELAQAQAAWITHVARTRRLWVEGPWLRRWVHNLVKLPAFRWEVTLPALLAFGAGLAWLRWRRTGRTVSSKRISGWLVAGPTLAALALWALRVPAPRFGFPLFWILAALTIAEAFRARFPENSSRSVNSWLLASLVIGLMPIGPLGWMPFGNAALPAWAISGDLFLRPGSDLWFAPMPRVRLTQYTTASGLTIHVPVKDTRCYAAPLPCTPHPASNLKLRVAGDLAAGFLTDGPWMQQNWPNAMSKFLELWRKQRDGKHWGHWGYEPR